MVAVIVGGTTVGGNGSVIVVGSGKDVGHDQVVNVNVDVGAEGSGDHVVVGGGGGDHVVVG